jgi:hypothetical protein
VSLVCEILWLGSLPFLFRRGKSERGHPAR